MSFYPNSLSSVVYSSLFYLFNLFCFFLFCSVYSSLFYSVTVTGFGERGSVCVAETDRHRG